jgi:hypothetical protein
MTNRRQTSEHSTRRLQIRRAFVFGSNRMTNHPGQQFRNNATMAEKEAVLRNDKRNATTLNQFATSEAREIEGRFAAREKATVVGTTEHPGLTYGWGPNWSHDPVPPEPPLGVDVHAHEPVGEFFEVEKSLGGVTTEASRDVAAQSDGASPAPTATPSQSSHSADARGQGDPVDQDPSPWVAHKPNRLRRRSI